MHLKNGSIKNHTRDAHDSDLTKEMLEADTKTIDKASDTKRLKYIEGVYINIHRPPFNVQGINAIIFPSDRERRHSSD